MQNTQQINISAQWVNLAMSILGSVLIFSLMALLEQFTRNSDIHALFRVFGGGSTFVGLLKVAIYAGCIYGALDIREKHQALRLQERGLGLNLLPLQDQLVLNPDEVLAIKLRAIDIERQGTIYVIVSLVKKVCAQYRNDKNIGDTLSVFSEQMEATKGDSEGKLEVVRYLAQTIPMVGFIGTITELSVALQQDLRNLTAVRQSMNGAFDATIVALVATMILTYLYHQYIGRLDVFFASTRSYITDNLISRIHSGR